VHQLFIEYSEAVHQLFIEYSEAVHQLFIEYSEAVHQLFIEFKKACDLVRREVLCNIPIEFGIPMKLLRLYL